MSNTPVDQSHWQSVHHSGERTLGFETEAEGSLRMLDIVFRNGDRIALPYAYLVGVALVVNQSLAMDFTERRIEVTGRNLRVLYEHLLDHTVKRIEESLVEFDDGNQVCWIETIKC